MPNLITILGNICTSLTCSGCWRTFVTLDSYFSKGNLSWPFDNLWKENSFNTRKRKPGIIEDWIKLILYDNWITWTQMVETKSVGKGITLYTTWIANGQRDSDGLDIYWDVYNLYLSNNKQNQCSNNWANWIQINETVEGIVLWGNRTNEPRALCIYKRSAGQARMDLPSSL